MFLLFFYFYFFNFFIFLFFYLCLFTKGCPKNDIQGNPGDCTDGMVTYKLGRKDPIHELLVT